MLYRSAIEELRDWKQTKTKQALMVMGRGRWAIPRL